MRTTEKTVTLPYDGHDQSFRLRKMDAFSGACLLKFALEKLLPSLPQPSGTNADYVNAPAADSAYDLPEAHTASDTIHVPSASSSAVLRAPTSAPAGSSAQTFSFTDLLRALSESDLLSLMTRCLSHVDILLPAGPHPVYQNQTFGLPELETDTLTCLNLCWEEMLFNLEGFFGESGSPSAATPT